MDWDSRAKLANLDKSLTWYRKFRNCRGERLTSWVSAFHPCQLRCRLANEDIGEEKRGSFNWTCKVVFANGEAWMVRFPIDGNVKNPDEKVEAEVATMRLVYEHTDIPVPEVKAWGLASENPLGLGPFIITTFVEGVSLADFLCTPGKSMIRDDVEDAKIQTIYQQIACFMHQLFQLNFPRIGSLSADSRGDDIHTTTISSRPVTWKSHEILNVGGVDVFCPPKTTFSSTSEYFQYVADQDWRHLHEQWNSVDDEEDARSKYIFWSVLKRLVPRFVLPEHDCGPFKLICDDFGPANMIVNNTRDLKIIAVLDWEWSYAGPFQLFSSPPRWLVIDRPNQWLYEDQELPRYLKYLDMFLHALEKQETNSPQDLEHRLSTIMRKQKTGGQMWFHHLIFEGFNGPSNIPFQKLRAAVPDFDELAATIPSQDVEDFVDMKMQHLVSYKEALKSYGAALDLLK